MTTTVVVRKGSAFGAMMMVTGCCIGAGMIGLPVLSAATGFMPSFLAMVLAYIFTTATGLLLLEATLWFKGRVNLMSIAEFALGKAGKIGAGLLFTFLFYSIFVAYLDGGGFLIQSLLFPEWMPRAAGTFATVLLVGSVLYLGTRRVDLINRVLMVGLVLSYGALVAVGLPQVKLENLSHVEWGSTLATLPILFICFGFQNLVPSLVHYLDRNLSAVRTAIVVGNLIPLFFYFLWNFVILGMISDPNSTSDSGMVTGLLGAERSLSIYFFINAFTFFALFTSFITIAISFVDFLRDGFKKPPAEWVLIGMVLAPPVAISLSYPRIFLQALDFAGGFIDVLLFGVLPALIVWVGRYRKGAEGPYRMAGGKVFLGVVLGVCMSLLVLRYS